jgi:hypothetical protein
MKKNCYEKLNDWFVNLYEQWLFIRCYEKSAILLSEITGYKLYPNIDKKTWFIFLECGFPKDCKGKITDNLEKRWNFIRLIDKDWKINEVYWNNKLNIDEITITKIKNNLIKFN